MNQITWRPKVFFEENRFELISIFIVLILYVENKFLFIPFLLKGKPLWFFRCYFNDLLCPLLFLPVCQIILKWAGINAKSYWLFLLLISIGGFVWEHMIPVITDKKISDPIDLIFYFLGMNVFYALMCMIKSINEYKLKYSSVLIDQAYKDDFYGL